ncbi:MAG: hypothetical protein EXR93_10290 [Gemmatimonadetes bacterium]|nr:hypothetical protein [Gemmatimonadota bacterium]
MRHWRTAAVAAFSLCLGLPSAPLWAQDTTKAALPKSDSAARAIPPRAAPADVPVGPLPPRSRYTFTRDSVAWSSAMSLADLLATIPGAYVARVGFLGQPEYVAYGGRGAATLEVYRDGVPVIPLGGDSLFIDPSRIPLTILQRVDIEVLPAQLRVYLESDRHQTMDTRSMVAVTSGDFGTGQYAGLFQKRWPAGLALNLGADFFASNGAPLSTRTDQAFEAWGRVEWAPTPTSGAVYQYRRQNDDHDAVVGLGAAAGTPARHGARTDASLRLFAAARADRRGFSGTLDVASVSWGADTILGDRTIRLAIGRARYATSRGAAELSGRLSDGPTKQALEGRAGWVLWPGILVSGDARASAYAGDRVGRRGHAALALYRGPVSLVGEATYDREPEAPALVKDSVRRTVDRSARLVLDTRLAGASIGVVRRGAYTPHPFSDLRLVPAASPMAASLYAVSDFRLQLIRPLTLEGWYAHPVSGGADFQPPNHFRGAVTFRSKFWRTFRSGAFDLKVQIAAESWSAGVAGRTAGGARIPLNALNFIEMFLAVQLVGFTAFWDLRNAWNTLDSYVPGFQHYPRNAQTFGVKWEFRN